MAPARQARLGSRDRGERKAVERPAPAPAPAPPPSPPRSHSCDAGPVAGTKRSFSNRGARQAGHGPRGESREQKAPGGEDGCHSEKRHRSADWPLVSASASPDSHTTPRPATQTRKPKSKSPGSARRLRAPIAPSKFLEGSMNDRVSQAPPVPYLDPSEDERLSQYGDAAGGEAGRGRRLTRGRFTHHRNGSVAESSNTADTQRSSSIFRFGKSIAASFNPVNWKFWSKEEHAEEDDEAAQRRLVHDRQIKAERIYQELKESGHFRDAAIGPSAFPSSAGKRGSAVTHDSGIEFGDLESSSARTSTSTDERRKGPVSLEPPRVDLPAKEFSPTSTSGTSLAPSNTPTPSGRSVFGLKKTSLSNLKHASLSNIRGAFTGDAASPVNLGLGIGDPQARRIPSRKDLQKQQKLVKRVSNLEERLKHARIQLAEVLQDPLPGDPELEHSSFAKHSSRVSFESQASSRVSRPRFVPGAMPSLPSERLLAGFVSSELDGDDEGEDEDGIGQAVTTDYDMTHAYAISGSASKETMDDVPDASHHEEDVEDKDGMVENTPPKSTFATHDDKVQGPDHTMPAKTAPSTLEVDEITPKPSTTLGTKKRKSDVADEEEVVPLEASDPEEVDEESDVLSEVSSIPKPGSKTAKSAPGSSGTAATITPTYPKKIQKTVPGSKTSSVSVPSKKLQRKPVPLHPESPTGTLPGSENIPAPTRTAPLPPSSQALGRSPSKKPVYSPHPSSRVYKNSKPVTASSNDRQQSASPPPTSISFTGPGLFYTKPSQSAPATQKTLDGPNLPKASAPKASHLQVPEREEQTVRGVPPMPPMPKAVRLASGEIIHTADYIAPPKLQKARSKASHASIKGASGESVRGKIEEREEPKDVIESVGKQSFEWPDDCF